VKVTVILQSEQPREREILTTGQSHIQDLAKVELLTITDSLDTDIEPASAGVVVRYKYQFLLLVWSMW